MSASFNVTPRPSERHTVVVSVAGQLDAHTASDLETSMHDLITGGSNRLVIDFAGLDYISSAGLGVFMVFIEQVRSNGGDIKLAAMQPKVAMVFELLGFQVLFEMYAMVDEAILAFPEVAA